MKVSFPPQRLLVSKPLAIIPVRLQLNKNYWIFEDRKPNNPEKNLHTKCKQPTSLKPNSNLGGGGGGRWIRTTDTLMGGALNTSATPFPSGVI